MHVCYLAVASGVVEDSKWLAYTGSCWAERAASYLPTYRQHVWSEIAVTALQVPMQTTDALNMTALPRRISAAEIDDFIITSDLAHGRIWYVEGEAIHRFAAMTNWDYYEATLRFQKVLDSAGEQDPQAMRHVSCAPAEARA